MLIIGIAGGTGSGKTTVARHLAESLPAEKVALIQHDSYYRDLRGLTPEQRAEVNFDHPNALETDLLIQDVMRLKSGETIEIPVYDYTNHVRKAETQRVGPTAVTIVEGILVLADERLRQLFDIKIFVDTDPDIRLMRRIRRDIEERGRSFRSVRDQYYQTVRPMHLQFVEPSKKSADVIIPEGGQNRVALDLILTKLQSVAGV